MIRKERKMETNNKNRMEIRIIGTREQLVRADEVIRAAYEVDYQSCLYSCKYPAGCYRQYYKVYEKDCSKECE